MSWGETMQACGDVLTAGYSTVLDCAREPDHEGPHRSYGGSEWNQEPGDPSPAAPESPGDQAGPTRTENHTDGSS